MFEKFPILNEIDCVSTLDYPTDATPEKGKDYIVTAASQIVVGNWETGEEAVYSPKLYQSSMHPEQKTIRTMKLAWDHGMLQIITPYEKRKLLPEEQILRVEPFDPVIVKPDCLHCTNCGRCSY
ncbi:MAG: hypothetical protein J5972_01695 [Eubacterium sp.]|nr:hypothetical protein [Eubacterium sp.]